MFSLDLSNEGENYIHPDEANAMLNKPVVRGEITGTLTRDVKMIFMNGYGYLFMNQTKTIVGSRCVRRGESCKAVVYTFQEKQEFSHWNGQFHSHFPDLDNTRKREILSTIKSRVFDEFIPTKAIIEEEHRKAQ